MVIMGILRYGTKCIGYQGHNHVGVDTVLGGAERPARHFRILRTSILKNTFTVVGTVDIHLTAAVGTVHQSCEGISFAPAVRVASDIETDALHVVKSFLVNNSLMGILEDRPLAFVHIMTFLVLKVLAGLKVNSVTKVFTLFDNLVICSKDKQKDTYHTTQSVVKKESCFVHLLR